MDNYDDDEVDNSSWIFYRDRPEWKDVEPVPQNDPPDTVVSIAYSDKFQDVHDYFRAILQLNEKSERAFKLTEDALELNPANYTIWHYRREIIKTLDLDIGAELTYSKRVIVHNPKNYQVWHHRRVLIEWSKDPSYELELTEEILVLDAKNYHAWQHRQWVIAEFKMHQNELNYINKLLKEDVRNNSAWNQRFFIVKEFVGFTSDALNKEILYSLGKIKLVRNNESAWNYLRGILSQEGKKLYDYPEVVKFSEKAYEDGCRASCLLTYLFDLYREKCIENKLDKEVFEKAICLSNELGQKYDTIRIKYWMYLQDELKKEVTAPAEA